MKNKLDQILDAIYGNKIKGRWKKVIISFIVIIATIFIFIFLLLNVGYNDKGFYIKPTEVKIDIKKEFK